MSLTPETAGILDERALQLIRNGALVINTAPMELFESRALKIAVAARKFHFILDHADEMTDADVRFYDGLESCTVYPPIGYLTREASERRFEVFARNIEAAAKGSALPNLVN
jgi:phosphoglycerate dehydrogenase-like enzyme